jgi:hypothetical protein
MKLITLLLLAFLITATQINARTWTHQESGRTIEAEYRGKTGDGENLKVNLRITGRGNSREYDGKDYEGIITVEGKTLKWCSTNDQSSAKRPREFQTDPQQNHFLIVLKREP